MYFLMQLCRVFLAVGAVEISLSAVNASLHSQFYHFEILTPQQITTRVKRDARTGKVRYKSLHFRSFGMKFKLSLTPGWSVVDDTADSKIVLANGSIERFQVDLSKVFSGKLNDDVHSSVQAFLYNGEWTARIVNSLDVYMIEPIRHYEPHSLNRRMILYRSRDVIINNTSVEHGPSCHEFSPDNFYKSIKNKSSITKEPKPLALLKDKQRSDSGTVCDMRAIVDYECLKNKFNNDIREAALKILYFHEISANIFSSTDWGDAGDLTIKVRSLLVHSEYTPVNSKYFKYNIHRSGTWDLIRFLTALFSDPANGEFCSNVLSSFAQMNDNALGGTVTTSLCDKESDLQYDAPSNAAFATFNYFGKTVSDARYIVDLTHQIGHQWGAHHDDVYDIDCGGIEHKNGGKYIMYNFISMGDQPNNQKFSPCSIRDIIDTVNSPLFNCLLQKQAYKSKVCGNGILEDGEACDAIGGSSKCCNRTCGLLQGAICDPSSTPCCTSSCKLAPNTQKCNSRNNLCLKDKYCDGVHHKYCPVPETMCESTSSVCCTPDCKPAAKTKKCNSSIDICHKDSYCDGKHPNSCPKLRIATNGIICGTAILEDNLTEVDLACYEGQCVSMCERYGLEESPPRKLVPCSCGNSTSEECCCKDLFDGLCIDFHCTGRDNGISTWNLKWLIPTVIISITVLYSCCRCRAKKKRKKTKKQGKLEVAPDYSISTQALTILKREFKRLDKKKIEVKQQGSVSDPDSESKPSTSSGRSKLSSSVGTISTESKQSWESKPLSSDKWSDTIESWF